MTRTRSPQLVVLAAVAALGLSACAAGSQAADPPIQPVGSTAAAPTPRATDASTAAPKTFDPADRSGLYITYADYKADPSRVEGRTVVLFFHATWCPTCRATDASLSTDGVPEGLAVVQVDFDSQTALRRMYGVTVQHTFVQIDAKGDKVKVWTGTTTGAAIAKQTT